MLPQCLCNSDFGFDLRAFLWPFLLEFNFVRIASMALLFHVCFSNFDLRAFFGFIDKVSPWVKQAADELTQCHLLALVGGFVLVLWLWCLNGSSKLQMS